MRTPVLAPGERVLARRRQRARAAYAALAAASALGLVAVASGHSGVFLLAVAGALGAASALVARPGYVLTDRRLLVVRGLRERSYRFEDVGGVDVSGRGLVVRARAGEAALVVADVEGAPAFGEAVRRAVRMAEPPRN